VDRLATGADRLLTARNVRVGSLVLLALSLAMLVLNVVLGDAPLTLIGTPVLPDFLAHWTGGRLLLDGRADVLYDAAVQLDLQRPMTSGATGIAWFVSPPFAALLYAPFALLPYGAAAVAWTVVSIGLVVAAMAVLRPSLPRLGGRDWKVVTVAVAATQPMLELVGAGQDSALSLFLWVSGVRLLGSGRDAAAGAVLALGLVKPQLFVLAPVVLLLQRRWRALASWAVVATGLALVSVLMVGASGVGTWLRLPFTTDYLEQVQNLQTWRMQGLPSWLASVAPPSLLGPAQVAGLALGAVAVAAFVVAVRRAPASAFHLVWAFAALTTVVASPHLLDYDLLFVVPALLFLLERHDSRQVRLMLLLLVVLTWTIWVRYRLAEELAWPASAVGASWSALPVAALWLLTWRHVRTAPAPPALNP
jgi:hypothetical protein